MWCADWRLGALCTVDLDPSQGDQACPAHISLLYKGVLRFTLGSYSVFLLDSWTWCVIQIVIIIQTPSSILTKFSLNIFTEYSWVVRKFPEINVKFHDQHMVDKWLKKAKIGSKNLVLRVSGENPVSLLCKNANFTAGYTESCAFGTRIYCDENKNSIFSSFLVMVRRKTLPVWFSETKHENTTRIKI